MKNNIQVLATKGPNWRQIKQKYLGEISKSEKSLSSLYQFISKSNEISSDFISELEDLLIYLRQVLSDEVIKRYIERNKKRKELINNFDAQISQLLEILIQIRASKLYSPVDFKASLKIAFDLLRKMIDLENRPSPMQSYSPRPYYGSEKGRLAGEATTDAPPPDVKKKKKRKGK